MRVFVFKREIQTAIVLCAGLLNALELQGKRIEDARIVCLGAGAAGIASMRLAVDLGAKRENMRLEKSSRSRWITVKL